jgi:predicted nucleotidyltransferase component of viral defense system
MTARDSGLQASIHARLINHAKAAGVDANLILVRYAMERFLYRLSRTSHAKGFVLKGGLLMLVWLGETIRPTRDADLLGSGDLSNQELKKIFRGVCVADVEPDGMAYDLESIRITDIREENPYGGKRVIMRSSLGKARIRLQADVGAGDAVSPPPEWLEYPTLLGMPSPRLRAYRPETTIAEKAHAMVTLGSVNSRMRDFFDIYSLAMRMRFDGGTLAEAIRNSFHHRRTALPKKPPLALTPGFSESKNKQTQWRAFLRKNKISSPPDDFPAVVNFLADFLMPVLAAADRSIFRKTWTPGGPWK